MTPPQGSKTKQGYELQLGTNCVAPQLFTRLLTPILVETAKISTPGSIRVVWVASSAAARFSPENGVDMNNLDYKQDQKIWHKYGVSKAGNILQAKAYASRVRVDGVVSVVTVSHHINQTAIKALDPGYLKTDLYRTMPRWQTTIVNHFLHEPIYGAYTELYAGLSPDISLKNTGAWSKLSSTILQSWTH